VVGLWLRKDDVEGSGEFLSVFVKFHMHVDLKGATDREQQQTIRRGRRKRRKKKKRRKTDPQPWKIVTKGEVVVTT
jgi:hypothetical protein